MIRNILVLMMSCIACQAFAKDYGTMGHAYEIKEEGFLSMIHRKLQTIDIAREQEKMAQQVKSRVEEPMAVENIKRTEKERVFTYDPTYILDKDAILPGGEILHSQGTRVNPFDYLSLDKKLIFIDGSDQEQVEWFKEQQGNGTVKEEDKLILIKGRPFDLGKETRRVVYFDQHGFISNKFGISQVPAIVEQEINRLKITEIRVDDKDN